MNVFLGIDWGGTYVKAGIVAPTGEILKKSTYHSQELKKKDIFIRQIKILIEDFKPFRVKAIGIGAPGIIDIKKGFIYYLPNIPGWHNYPLRNILEKELKLPVFLDNDANVFALAEARLGAGKGKKNVIFLTLGTGLGGAVIFNGKILEAETSAAELGHVPLSLKGRQCGCGGRGCVETFTGTKNLLKRYSELKGRKFLSNEVKEIYYAALKKDRAALIVWKEFSRSLGMFLAGMVNIFNPEVIIFGGGVSGAFNLFKPLLWQVLQRQTMWPQLKNLKLVKAKLKDAGIIGAGLLAKENIEADIRGSKRG
jgi:glucokinase